MTLQELTTAIAKANPGMTSDTVSRFVNAFFASVTESLIKDGNVKISGFGTFVHTEEPRHQVSFIPAEKMADTVNAPFSMFEPEELADDVTDEMLESGESEEKTPEPEATEQQAEPETSPESEPTASAPAGTVTEPTDEPAAQEPEPQPESATVTEQQPEPEPEPEEATEENDEQTENTEKETVIVYRNVFPWWYALIAGLVAGTIIGGAILYTHFDSLTGYSDEEDYTEESELIDEMAEDLALAEAVTDSAAAIQSEDTIREVKPAEPEIREVKPAEPEVITETVSPRNYLTTMAKRHYGKDVFWVYIYLENSGKLKHPDRISPNTVVVIPPASKYGIDKNDPKSVASAKQKGAEIYSKYK